MKINWGFVVPTSVRVEAMKEGAKPQLISAQLIELKRGFDSVGKLNKLTATVEIKDNRGQKFDHSYALNPHEIGDYLIEESSLHIILNRMTDAAWGRMKKIYYPGKADEVEQLVPEMQPMEEKPKPKTRKWEIHPDQWMLFHNYVVPGLVFVLALVQLKSCIGK